MGVVAPHGGTGTDDVGIEGHTPVDALPLRGWEGCAGVVRAGRMGA